MDTRTDAGHAGTTNGRHDEAMPREDELETLADLFLGPSDPPAEPGRVRPRVEALVLGHLPVFAAAWPSQLARHMAEERGSPVAIVRWEAGSLSVQLVASGGAPRVGVCASDSEAIAAALRSAGLVLLRVPEASEAELVSLPGLDQVSILTGADDAAIVACYRRLKGLAADAERVGSALPGARLVVMGASEEKARTAHERVLRAARAFLEADLRDPVVIPRIAPVHSATLAETPTSLTLAGLAELLRREGTQARRVEAPSAPAPGAFEPVEEARARTEPEGGPDREPGVGSAAGESTSAGESVLALVPGLAALVARCPGAGRVALARDGAGGLHLVAASLARAPEVSAEDPLGDLLAAAAWARDNAGLLARAEGVSLSDAAPVLHLVTDSPARARKLVGSLVRVHLAAPAGAAAFGLVAVSLGG